MGGADGGNSIFVQMKITKKCSLNIDRGLKSKTDRRRGRKKRKYYKKNVP